jgi:hypothetical protein
MIKRCVRWRVIGLAEKITCHTEWHWRSEPFQRWDRPRFLFKRGRPDREVFAVWLREIAAALGRRLPVYGGSDIGPGKNWDSLLLDGDNENAATNLHRHFLTPSHICP